MTVNCPECDTVLHGDKCRSCGWERKAESVRATPNWEPPDYIRNWQPPTPEQHAEMLALIRETTSKLGVRAAERPTPKAERRKCKACEMGTLIHGGVRYCLECYRKL